MLLNKICTCTSINSTRILPFYKKNNLHFQRRQLPDQSSLGAYIRKQNDETGGERISWTFSKRCAIVVWWKRRLRIIMFLSLCRRAINFFLSLAISRASTAALSIAATCETLGFYVLSRQISRAEIDIWSRTSCNPCAQYTRTQFADIKSEDDLTLLDVYERTRKTFIFKGLFSREDNMTYDLWHR